MMFELWDNLGAYAPSFPGDPGTGVDIGRRLINPRSREILPEPPLNCSAEYRAKYLAKFGVDPSCTPLAITGGSIGMPKTPGVESNAGPGGVLIDTGGVTPFTTPLPPVPRATQPTSPPVSPPVIQPMTPVAPRTKPMRRVRPGKSFETDGGYLCPSYGHYNRPIPGVDEYQVLRCTPGQPIPRAPIGLRRVVRQEALARHPGGGRERTGRAGDYQGRARSSSSSSFAEPSSSMGTGSICLSPMLLIAVGVGAFFLFKK